MKSKASNSEEKLENHDFDLFKAIEAVDKKDYNWFSNLTEEQQKKFVPYMMLHWISAVRGNSQLSSYYLMSTELQANKHMFNEHIQRQPELQWMMLCASSPGIGKQFHQWIPHITNKAKTLKERVTQKEVKDYFEKIYKNSDSELITQYAKEFTHKQNHKHRLATIFPNMKLDDIEQLSQFVTEEDIREYEQASGN